MLKFSSNKDWLLITDPKILQIPIHDNKEPLFDLKLQNIIAFDFNKTSDDYTKVRKSVYKKLTEAQLLLPNNYKLCLFEGYRSLNMQKKLFQERYEQMKNLNKNWQHKDIFIETTKFVSPIINLDGSYNVPPHSTGAAIDVCLINNLGEILDMGLALSDSFKDHNGSLSATDSKMISVEAQSNRKLMSNVLSMVNFINYPSEYWHWSYGDRYWAYYCNQKFAFYGSI